MLEERDLAPISSELEGVVAMDAVFDRDWVKKLDGFRVKQGDTKLDLARALMDDIERFRVENECGRLVMVWCGSTEAYREPTEVHQSVASFEQGLRVQGVMDAMHASSYAGGAPVQPARV